MKTKKELKKWFCSILGAVLLTAVIGLPKGAFALDVGEVEIHGYGDQAFMVTDKNEFMGADNKGSWNNNSIALLLTSKVTDDTTIWIQLFSKENNIALDWAFVDYRFNNNLSVQIGQTKLPMGIYNEIRDIRFLQLSTTLPYMYEEQAELIHEAYRGVKAIYNLDLGSGGEIVLSPFGGQLFSDENPTHKYGQMYGANINYKAPLDGFSVVGSGLEGDMGNLQANMTGDMLMLNAAVDYVNYGFDLKAEYTMTNMSMKGNRDIKNNSYYIQAGYTLFDKLTPFVRYDSITKDEDNSSDPSNYQKGIVMGAGYKINYNVSLKAEYQINDGLAMLDSGTEKNWNMFITSINFIF